MILCRDEYHPGSGWYTECVKILFHLMDKHVVIPLMTRAYDTHAAVLQRPICLQVIHTLQAD